MWPPDPAAPRTRTVPSGVESDDPPHVIVDNDAVATIEADHRIEHPGELHQSTALAVGEGVVE